MKNETAIYQTKNGGLELKTNLKEQSIWANQKQIATIFGLDRSVVTKHINKIVEDNEVDTKSNVQKMHIANSDKPVAYYSLDIILAVGYRTNSTQAIKFRQWATKVLKHHIKHGFSINQKVLESNKEQFLKTLSDLKILSQDNQLIETKDIISLIQFFSTTFFNLENFDKNNFPKEGSITAIKVSAKQLKSDLQTLKNELIETFA